MSHHGQSLTKSVYEDPEIVEGYIQRNSLVPKQIALITTFAQSIGGRKVLDLGCGPGHDSYLLADLGFEVTGLDYSAEMIRRAKTFKQSPLPPKFVLGDMCHLPDYFAENTFDAIWASASLLHIQPDDLPQTLQGMTHIIKPSGVIYIGLKAGQGTLLVTEDKLGKPMQREFTLWNKDSFIAQTSRYGWVLTDFSERAGTLFQGQPTHWLNFFFSVPK